MCAGTRTLVSAAACPSLMDSEYGIELTENAQDPEEQHIVDGRNSGVRERSIKRRPILHATCTPTVMQPAAKRNLQF